MSALLHGVYSLHQSVWSAWARRHYRSQFEHVSAFCLFVGYPRSGHSLVGALLNAHPQAVISHELDAPALMLRGCARDELFARILARARWFHLRGDRSNYDYAVPGQWQGRFRELAVVGDKRGGALTRHLEAHPDLLERVRALVRVPLRLVHVVRNPFDNIAAIAAAEGRSLADSAGYYFRHCRTTNALTHVCAADELLTLHHEEVVADPPRALRALTSFVGLSCDDEYVRSCSGVVFPRPTYSRRRHVWPDELVRGVLQQAAEVAFLRDYRFELPDSA